MGAGGLGTSQSYYFTVSHNLERTVTSVFQGVNSLQDQINSLATVVLQHGRTQYSHSRKRRILCHIGGRMLLFCQPIGYSKRPGTNTQKIDSWCTKHIPLFRIKLLVIMMGLPRHMGTHLNAHGGPANYHNFFFLLLAPYAFSILSRFIEVKIQALATKEILFLSKYHSLTDGWNGPVKTILHSLMPDVILFQQDTAR